MNELAPVAVTAPGGLPVPQLREWLAAAWTQQVTAAAMVVVGIVACGIVGAQHSKATYCCPALPVVVVAAAARRRRYARRILRSCKRSVPAGGLT